MAADLILTNGVVHTVDAARSVREAVAVADGRILAVGSAAEIAELAGPGTRIVDVEGGMVLPGFQDAHCHLALSGYEQHALRPVREPQRRGAPAPHRASTRGHTPTATGSLGGGWSMSDFPGGIPTREQLDAVVADRPAVLHQPRRARMPGRTPARWSWPESAATRPTRPAGGSSGTSRASRWACCRSRRWAWCSSLAPEPDADQRAAGRAAQRRSTTTAWA